MNEEKCEAQRCFYQTCCDLLGLPQSFVTPHYRLTRWNNRDPGNGRMEGFGTIRRYSDTLIHISFRAPASVNRTFGSEDAVYDFLKNLAPKDEVEPAG